MFKTSEECQLELVAHTTSPISIDEFTFQMNSDWLPVSAARASFGKEDKTGEDEKADRKLMKFLADHRHVSCFEHNYATFLVECPLFVRSQIMRHKSFSFNEVSRRYTSEKIEFWIPDKLRKQSKSNKQASTDEFVDISLNGMKDVMKWSFDCYEFMLGKGACREQARAVLPQSLLTRFYMSGNLRSWWSFLTSRLKEDTQRETRVVAQRIEKELRGLWPESMSALLGDPNE